MACSPRSTGAYQVPNDHQSRSDAYARLERRLGLQTSYSSDQLQSCAHGSLCVVFMCLRIAKVDQHSVAHVLGNEATEALHGLCDALLVR